MAYVKRNKYVFYCNIVVACCINGLERQINKLEKKRMVVPGIKKKKKSRLHKDNEDEEFGQTFRFSDQHGENGK